MPQLTDEQIEAARNELETMLIRLTGKSNKLTLEEVGGTGEWYQKNAPNHPFAKYYEAMGENPAAIVLDLKRRFPETFNTHGFGDASTVDQDTAASEKNSMFNSGGATQAAGSQRNMLLLAGAAIVGGAIWYFNK